MCPQNADLRKNNKDANKADYNDNNRDNNRTLFAQTREQKTRHAMRPGIMSTLYYDIFHTTNVLESQGKSYRTKPNKQNKSVQTN
jgi:hypothetical protein